MEPIGAGVRPRSVRRLWAGMVLGGLALATTASPADAQERQGTRVEVEAGYGGLYYPGRRLPITVTIRADRLIQGSIEVSIPGQAGLSWGTEVEVPGGGVNDFVVVVPTPATMELNEVQVRLVGAGNPIREEVELDAVDEVELVGLLPEAMPADVPAPLELPLTGGTARFAELDVDAIATLGVLDPLGTVVAGTDELGRLAPVARAAILDWVDRGGRLVVDATTGTDVAGLPDEWQPGERGRTAAGLGEVRAVGGAVAAGRWSDVVEPTPTVSFEDLFQFGGIPIAQLEAVGDAVARDAGLSALDVPWLLFFLLAYVALVGPVAWIVLRRRRAALGWLVIPIVAGLFTAGSFVVGSDLRSGTTAAHGTVLETGPAGARATTVLGLVSRNGSDGRGSFPSGWTAGGVDASPFIGPGQVQSAGNLAVRTDGDGIQATVPLAAGGFGVLRGSGTEELDGGLVVEARSVGDEVVGTVRNDLPFDIQELGVMLGRVTEKVGRLGAGETTEFTLDGQEVGPGRDVWSPPEAALWPGAANFGAQPDYDSVVNLALWNDVHMSLGPNARARGVVTAVGWTRALDTPAAIPGESDPIGRSAIVGRAPVVSEDGTIVPGSAHRELVRAASAVELPDDDVDVRVNGWIWRFALPAGSSLDQDLTVVVPGYLGRVDVWDGSGWVVVDDRLDEGAALNGDPNNSREATVPAELASTGVVWVRGWMLADWGGFDGAGLEVFRA